MIQQSNNMDKHESEDCPKGLSMIVNVLVL
jgi:hypothetical protein